MGVESPKPGGARGAVFLSHASEDAEAAKRVCDSLRAAGIEVWLDQSELRGGDAWDAAIRERIHDCRLFLAVISANTEARDEGYFRREWKLAVERTHDMAEKKTFILPVVIDTTAERGACVPGKFHDVQWTRLPGGEATPEFITRVGHLLSAEPATVGRELAVPVLGAASIPATAGAVSLLRRGHPAAVAALAVICAAGLAYLLRDKPWRSQREAPTLSPTVLAAPAAPGAPATAAFAPPTHSIAVLPFVNLSGDPAQDYFSDGLTEELLNSLAAISELQVAARTSSFSFREHPDVTTVAHKLNVATVLEGSVRRSAHTVRITAQLINGASGFHLWSKTYDRDPGDVLKLQSEIATAVATALKVTLLGDVTGKIELGGTRNPNAFDAYLRGTRALSTANDGKDLQTAVAAYTEAIRLDPNYALAYAGRSRANDDYAGAFASATEVREVFDKAEADARRAIALAPDLAEGHLALADRAIGVLDLRQADESYERALALAPGNAAILDDYGRFAVAMGRTEAGISALHRAVALDPLNAARRRHLGQSLNLARRYEEAVTALREAVALDDSASNLGWLGITYYSRGDFRSAQSSCESESEHQWLQLCLALVYERIGRRADADAELGKYRAHSGDTAAYQYAEIYAQRGEIPAALQWLGTALRLRDPGLIYVKTDPFLDPLRKEPRFQAIVRELRFPE